ncbi:MAG: SPOR domain-containing protein [Rhodanobacter sp.]|nr:MAG: SPOR domain-containing protein [Rhodanobacter sp.]TAL91428.1 MAG: SPOR domain-containing protein [Rhodanobacter sp.]TAM42131.1 MAG: SPOR domain-containing protein [Rhodanobacter sp.]TAN26732.1 MAG: SPOR domain-containing protein [Rhodanobacter sp.]
MKTRLLGAAVLIALVVIFVPMFFSGSPPAPGSDQSVSLAIPPAPDRDLQTRTMNLNPGASVSTSGAAAVATSAAAPAPGDRIATVSIDSNRPRDVELDPEAGRKPKPPTVTIGSGASPTQPVIPQRGTGATAAAAPAGQTPATRSPGKPAVAAASPGKPTPIEAKSSAALIGHGSYTLNLSAYASPAGAARLQHRVRALGYPVTGHAITQAGKPRTLVIAGPFATRTAAEAARLKITQSIPGLPARLEQDASANNASAAATASPGKPGGWAVQLAAVSSQADAVALRDKLRAAGFDGFVDSVQSGGKTLWRVRAGPQIQRVDAQRVHDQIKTKLGIDGNVVSVP